MELNKLIQKIKLPYISKGLESKFIDDYTQEAIPYFRISIIFVILASIPYALLDLSMIPNSLKFVWIIRFAVWIPSLIIAFLLSYNTFFKKYYQIIVSAIVLLLGFGVEAMIIVADKSELAFTMYYAGIAVIMPSAIVMRLRFKYSAIVLSVVSFAYVFIAIYIQDMLVADASVNYQVIFINNSFFLFTFTVVLILASYILESFSRNNFLQKQIIIQEQLLVKEKNEELNQQNDEITAQRDEIEIHKNLIEKSHEHIISSVNYAKRIQTAMLPTDKLFKTYFSEYFILFKPRDIVSGDFYWAKKINNRLIYAVADCTGHGVPGAFVSMLGMSLLNEIIIKNNKNKASQILNDLRIALKTALKQTDKYSGNKDGMDIALCIINIETNELQFAGAYNPLYILRAGELIELKADRQPIAIYTKEKPFTNHIFNLQKDDILYTFSDGYIDQFNGITNEKFKTKRFKKILINNSNKSLTKQNQMLEQAFINWQAKDGKQTDDIIIIGTKIK